MATPQRGDPSDSSSRGPGANAEASNAETFDESHRVADSPGRRGGERSVGAEEGGEDSMVRERNGPKNGWRARSAKGPYYRAHPS